MVDSKALPMIGNKISHRLSQREMTAIEDVHKEEAKTLGRSSTIAEIDGLKSAFQAIAKERDTLHSDEGMSQTTFFFGVVNVAAISMVLVAHPEHFWLLYGVESLVLIPIWLRVVHTVYKGWRFIFDFCWVVNSCFAIYALMLFCQLVPQSWTTSAFIVFYSVSLGPLAWACLVLHNGLVFHSAEKTASLFIHFMPTVVSWTIVTYPDLVAAQWPGRFPEAAEIKEISCWQLFSYGMGIYLLWLAIHGIWLVVFGVDCPKQGQNTVFNNLYEKNHLDGVFQQKFGLKSIRSHAVIYLVIHCLGVILSFSWPLLCIKVPEVHLLFNILMFLSAAWNGAGYYEYVMAKRYYKVVKALIEEKQGASFKTNVSSEAS